MLKAFCDKCGEACGSENSSAKNFGSLLKGKNVSVGLEVSPLYDGLKSGAGHICDECMPDLLFKAARTFSKAKCVAAFEESIENGASFITLKSDLDAQLAAVVKREKLAEAKLREAKEYISEADKQRKSDAERLNVLAAQIKNIQSVAETRNRQAAAAEAQNKIDHKENPEYVDRVKSRARIGMQK